MANHRHLLTAFNVSKTYKHRRWLARQEHPPVHALGDVSLEVGFQRTLAIVGESGAGKSTLARCLAGLEWPDTGEVRLEGRRLRDLSSSELRSARKQIQLIFQDSAASLNPAFSGLEVVTEPATIARAGSRRQRRQLGLAMMDSMGLPRDAADRKCSELSGGERQRLAIGRALTLSPKLLVLDEALSGLDLLIQAQLLNLLFDLQSSRPVSYIFISHDLRLAAHVADDLVVMQSGRIVEQGPADQVSGDPRHPHTRALLSAAAGLALPR